MRKEQMVPWCLLVVWLALAGCGKPPAAVPEVIPVRVAEALDAAVSGGDRGSAYLATIKGRNQITLSFKVPGIVDLVGPGGGAGDWKEGALVRRGELLAQLKQSDFLAASNSAAAQAQLDQTQYQRVKRLLGDGAASQQEYDRALASMRASDAALELRRQDLLDSRILAPFAGTILKREVNAGETIGAGRPALTMADLSEVEVEVGVPDRLVGDLKPGDEVRMAISALGNQDFRGVVKEVGVAAQEGSRLFRVVIKVMNSDGGIRAGMTASVFLDEAVRRREGVLVPLSALVARGERDLAVFVVKDGVARERRVETRDIVESSILVSQGLSAGEVVVVTGASQLYDGAKVAVANVASGTPATAATATATNGRADR
ncbi:MAG: efflux RND transporter periplasmic adaptor subunit [Verrucomicrobiales bacterium]|nr:efflux RND transporter periplasmic adaptor subunit [Verrucomicrobiales bacterium]